MGWFRAYDGISTDPKYGAIADRCGQPVPLVVAVWLHVLDEANQSIERGSVHVDSETLASFLRCSPEAIEAILDAMNQPRRDGSAGLIDGGGVTAWRKRQPLREDDGATERKRRQRDRERADATMCDEEMSRNGHAMSRDVTHGHALQDRQKDRQKERQTLVRADSQKSAPDGAAAVAADCVSGRLKPLGEPPGFAEFYVAYPRKVARPAAAKAYGKAVKRMPHDAIMAGLERSKSAWHRRCTDKEHIPHPATWLNADRWADDDAEPAKPQRVKEGYGYGII